MLAEKLKDYHIILASGSPRRQQFLRDLGLDFEIRIKEVDESFDENLQGVEIARFLAGLKAEPYLPELQTNDILITGDTVVWFENEILHKPKNYEEAVAILSRMSGKMHEVISACRITSTQKNVLMSETTKVFFKNLTPEEIDYYVTNFKPYDKAGAYGIQEWIGLTGISKIEGSFYNVMGMPIDKVYEVLRDW